MTSHDAIHSVCVSCCVRRLRRGRTCNIGHLSQQSVVFVLASCIPLVSQVPIRISRVLYTANGGLLVTICIFLFNTSTPIGESGNCTASCASRTITSYCVSTLKWIFVCCFLLFFFFSILTS